MLVRRPHAYRFVRSHGLGPNLADVAGALGSNGDDPLVMFAGGGDAPDSITLPDGTLVDGSDIVVLRGDAIPIPGFVVLTPDGDVEASVSLFAGDARERLLDALR